jgi:RNA polymerase sigma-70 factor (sigma-E family)
MAVGTPGAAQPPCDATVWAAAVVWQGEEVVMDSGADAEFSEFMHGRWSGLVRLGYGLTGDQGLAEDLAQTALARAYASWPRVRRAGDPDAYLRRIMINANAGRFRKRRVPEQLTDRLPDLGTADATRLQDDRTALIAALQSLPPGQRSVVVLRYWMDMTETEVAAVLRCSVGNVKSQASRALAKLRVSADLAEGKCHEPQ